MEYPLQLDTGTITQFRDNGFVVTNNVLDEREIETYGKAVDQQVRLRTKGDERSLVEKSVYEQSFIQCMRLWETCPTVRRLSCHPGLAGIASQLLGEPEVLLWQDQALYKEPGGRETTPHQDQTFWPIGGAPLVSAWIPFDDVGLTNGAMSYVPGSHQHGPLKVVDITHSTEPYDILDDPALKGAKPQLVEVKAGSVIWHHGFTIHLAAENKSDNIRRVFTVVYLARGYPRVKSWPVFPLDRAGVQSGELMEGDGMPPVWPAVESLPEPPEHLGQPTGPQHG